MQHALVSFSIFHSLPRPRRTRHEDGLDVREETLPRWMLAEGCGAACETRWAMVATCHLALRQRHRTPFSLEFPDYSTVRIRFRHDRGRGLSVC